MTAGNSPASEYRPLPSDPSDPSDPSSRIGVVSFRQPKADAPRANPESYEPSAELAAEEEDAKHKSELAAMRRRLDESNARQTPSPPSASQR